MRQPPFDVELIALGHMRTVGTNSKKNQGRTTVAYPPKCGTRTTAVKICFQKHSIRSTMKIWEKSQILVILASMMNELHSTNLRMGGWAFKAPPPHYC